MNPSLAVARRANPAVAKADRARACHERVRTWTKSIDIFSKDFLFIPIHDYLHWSLVIIAHPGRPREEGGVRPLILHLDSMQGRN